MALRNNVVKSTRSYFVFAAKLLNLKCFLFLSIPFMFLVSVEPILGAMLIDNYRFSVLNGKGKTCGSKLFLKIDS